MLRTRLIAGVTSGIVLSAALATAVTVANFGETMVEPWRIDPSRPAPITLRMPRMSVRTFDAERGVEFATVTATIPRGSIVHDASLATMVRIYERDRRPPRPEYLAAQWLVYFLLVQLVVAFMRRGGTSPGALLRTQVGLSMLALGFVLAGKAVLLFTVVPALVLPVAVVPLWAARFVDRRTAVLVGGVLAFLSASLVFYDPILGVVFLVECVVSPLVVRRRNRSLWMLAGGGIGGLSGATVYVAAKEIFDGFALADELAAGWLSGPALALAAGVAGGVVAFLLQPIVARVLGIVSRGQLLNLTDVERPLLKKMAAEAHGSWEHARAMANLAEEAAAAIHADPLLTRVGAYYHDLGKTVQAKYFVENLAPGETSPHEDLDPDVSADAIMAHVIEGTRILREGGIPEPVVEFAYTHHGTSVIEYFWNKCQKQGNPRKLKQDAFRYPGMTPRTKETAILMLIDSIEAGARTVEPPSRAGFEELVRRVVFSKLHQGQLDHSGLTIGDLHVMTQQISDTLCSVYHSRIRYPWQDAKEGEAPPEAARAAQNGPTPPGGSR
jgi:hypothetical protein